jgi:Tfp pilus assembly protein PilF
LEEFRKVLAEHPDHVVAYFNLGVVFQGLGEKDSARYYWEKYLQIDPSGKPADAARQYLREMGT